MARRRQGDIESLRRSGEKLGFGVHAVPMLDIGACRASSSNIREVSLAVTWNRRSVCWAGRISMTGRVIKGRQLGRQLGYPTANIRLATDTQPVKGCVRDKGPLG